MRGFGLAVLLVCGCQGEQVQNQTSDAGSDTTTTASDAQADGTVVAGDCGTHSGGRMVRVGAFCMDVTEVTRGELRKYLLDPTHGTKALAFCSWNTTEPAPETDDRLFDWPASMVNFCDAASYCAWAGKRLCGKVGGGMNDLTAYNDAAKSEWFLTCTANGTQTYAYPGSYDKNRCFSEEGTSWPTGAKSDCHGASGPFAQILDLSGNVGEWEYSCQGSAPTRATECRYRGGTHGSGTETSCAVPWMAGAETRLPGIGFRCCKD